METKSSRVVEHFRHIPFRYRFIASSVICITSLGVWYITHNEMWYKAFELSAAPFLDKLIFGAME